MTLHNWLTVALLAGAALIIGWPAGRGRARRRAVLGSPSSGDGLSGDDFSDDGLPDDGLPGDGFSGDDFSGTGRDVPSAGHPAAVRHLGAGPAAGPASPVSPPVGESTRRRSGSGSLRRPMPVAPRGRDGGADPSRPPGRRDPQRPSSASRGDPGRLARQQLAPRSPLVARLRRLAWASSASPDTARVDRLRTLLQGVRSPASAPNVLAPPRRALLGGAVLGGCLGGLLAGPVAAVLCAAYTTLGVRGLLRRRAARNADQWRRHRLDQLCAAAADLRAGLPVPTAIGALTDGTAHSTDRVGQLVQAAARLADRTGAPLAELVERIETDLRAMERGLAAAAAQAAGARATAWLLAALPLGGVALGYGIGVDPLDVLLRTPIGAACAIGATILQLVGLLWAERLSNSPTADESGPNDRDRSARLPTSAPVSVAAG